MPKASSHRSIRRRSRRRRRGELRSRAARKQRHKEQDVSQAHHRVAQALGPTLKAENELTDDEQKMTDRLHGNDLVFADGRPLSGSLRAVRSNFDRGATKIEIGRSGRKLENGPDCCAGFEQG